MIEPDNNCSFVTTLLMGVALRFKPVAKDATGEAQRRCAPGGKRSLRY